MAWGARPGLRQQEMEAERVQYLLGEMDWEARSGWKQVRFALVVSVQDAANWPGEPVRDGNFPIPLLPTTKVCVGMAWGARSGLKQFFVLFHDYGAHRSECPGQPGRDGNTPSSP